MDQYSFMKQCLIKFNYPNIHSLNDLEISNVFATSNRQFLISWILRQINDEYSSVVLNSTIEDLADLVYCNGFCKNSEKIQFINGECSSDAQLDILYKMFKYLEDLFEIKNTDEEGEILSNEELETILDFNTNLFPMYGPKQVLTTEERNNKIKEYENEMEQLQNIIAAKRSDNPNNSSLEINVKNKLSSAMGNLEINGPNFKRKVLDIMKQRDEKEVERICFKQNFPHTLQTCNKNAENMLEFIKNMNVLEDFNENNAEVKDADYDNKSNVNMLRELAEICTDISNL